MGGVTEKMRSLTRAPGAATASSGAVNARNGLHVLNSPEVPGELPELRLALRESVERALDLGGRPVHRLGSAGTSVTFLVVEAEEMSLTLLLDRHPPEVVDGSEPAEITIELTPEQAARFARGELILPNCILRGEVPCRGPVRKYLAFDPILRALLGRASDQAHGG